MWLRLKSIRKKRKSCSEGNGRDGLDQPCTHYPSQKSPSPEITYDSAATNRPERCFLFRREKNMSRGSHPLSSLLLAAALASSLAGIACASTTPIAFTIPTTLTITCGTTTKIVYYNRWAVETHRDPHRDFRKLPPRAKGILDLAPQPRRSRQPRSRPSLAPRQALSG